MKLKVLTVALVLSLLPESARAALHCQPKVSTCGTPEMVPPDKPMEGLGDLTHPVSTTNPLAQKFFDQGLTLHYAFNNEQAILSFRKAAELDPSLAMAHWGIALAASTNINVPIDSPCAMMAREHIGLAQTIAKEKGASKSEQKLIDALAALYSEPEVQDEYQRMVNYSLEMEEVYKLYPGDADVATLYADSLMNLQPWKLWVGCEPVLGTATIRQVLEKVLKADTTRAHLGANHFYIHTMEGSCTPELANPSARLLREAKLFAAGHLMHMPSHIAIRTGDYFQATLDNEGAVKADKEMYGKACDDGDPKKCLPLYVGHYLEPHTEKYVKNEPGLEHFLVTRILTLARFSKWQEVLDVPPPNEKLELKMAQAVWRWARTVALAVTDAGAEKIAAERKLYQDAARQVPPDLSWGNNKATAYFPLMNYLLSGHLAEHGGNRAGAIELFKLAVNEEDQLIYDEPNPWLLTVRETLGGAYLRNSQFPEAERVFKDDLKPQKNPGNGRSLFGLWKSLEGQCSQGPVQPVKAKAVGLKPRGKCQPDKVKKAEKDFRKAWQYADVELTIEGL
jgi:tetratricopeptide (TPR) repeat protein